MFGIDKLNVVFSAVGPIIEAEVTDVEAVARTLRAEYLVTVGENSYYQTILFSDPELLDIFDFNYIDGNDNALDNPSGIVITETSAIKYFGRSNVVGEVITLDNEFEFHVGAVVEDVPQNSHFNSSVVQEGTFEIVAAIKALGPMRDFDEAGDWNNLSLGNMTYVLLPAGLDGGWLQTQVDSIYERLVPEEQYEVVSSFYVDPLQHANLAIWDALGMPGDYDHSAAGFPRARHRLCQLHESRDRSVAGPQPGDRHAQDDGCRATTIAVAVPGREPGHRRHRDGAGDRDTRACDPAL